MLTTFVVFPFFSSFGQTYNLSCAIDTSLGCGVNCFDLNVQFPDIRSTSNDYTVSDISNTIICNSPVSPALPGTSTSLVVDDTYSTVIALPFSFNFYGTVFNSLIVSTNGYVSFDVSQTGQFSHYDDFGNLPNSSYDRALIMGPYHDLDPSSFNNPPFAQIKYDVVGTAPYRKFIVSFYKSPLYDCDFLINNVSQIVLHESSGIIETLIYEKEICFVSNNGKAMVGLQNFNRNKAVMAPLRRMTDPAWGGPGFSEGWRFVPSEGNILYKKIELFDAGNVLVATGDTTRIAGGGFKHTFAAVCPPTDAPTTYIVKVTYSSFDNPTQDIVVSQTVTVTRNGFPASLQMSPTSCGANTGSITATPSGGTAPHTYTLNGGTPQASNVFNNLAAGFYTVNITDATGCIKTLTITVTATSNLQATFTQVNASCPGVNNGQVTITPTTGTAPYTYTVNGGTPQASNIFLNLTPGSNVFVFTDANGCTGTITVNIGPGSNISGSATSTSTTCATGNNGTITANGSLGVAPYIYSINNGPYQANNAFTGLVAGTYTIRIQDSRGCTFTISRTVNAGSGLQSNATVTNIACGGGSTGTITVNPVNGTAPYLYAINGGPQQASNIFTGLAAGSYIITVQDASGCTVSIGRTITNTGALSATSTSTATSCAGASDGTITVTPTSGTAPYIFSLDGGPGQAGGTFAGVASGSHTIIFTDINGCSGSLSQIVAAGAALGGSSSSTGTSCPQLNNGSITVTPTIPGAYSYTLQPGNIAQTSGLFTNLATGSYTIIFINTVGCSGSVVQTVTAGPAITGTTTASATSCPQVSDGTISVAPTTPGTYSYNLQPGNITQASGLFTNLAAGSYTITFTNAAGCIGNVSQTVNAGPAITGTATTTATSCPQLNDGRITVSPGVPGAYSYNLQPGNITQASATFTNLAAGTYTITFTSTAGCTGTVSQTVTSGPALSSTVTQNNAACANSSTGSITIVPGAGNAPYSYSITPGTGIQSSAIFNGLAAGNYTYSFTDGGGCIGTGSFTVTASSPISTPVAIVEPRCFGDLNGSATFTPAGGIAPYTYALLPGSTFQTSSTFSNLSAGTYTFRIKDNVGCTQDSVVTIGQPASIAASALNSLPATCFGNDGVITISGTGGTLPYTYSIDNGLNYQSSNTFTAPNIGTYNGIKIKGANGCESTTSATVLLNDTMRLTLPVNSTICAETSITLQPQTNEATSVFTWTAIPSQAINTLNNPGIKNPIATPLATTNYRLSAQWGICSRTAQTAIVVLTKPIADAGADVTICAGDSTTLRGVATNLSGTVSYTWTPNIYLNRADSNIVTSKPTAASSSTYTLTVRDNYGCNFAITDQVIVTVRPIVPAFAGNDTTAITGLPHQLEASGGSSYAWSPSAPLSNASISNPIAILQQDTRFALVVTDVAGCKGYDSIDVKVYNGPTYYVPTAFTPNGDGRNDIFRATPVGIVSTTFFRIFDRYGNLIFETNQILKGWDGRYKGSRQSQGVYVWVIKGIDRNGKEHNQKGTVILLR